MILEQRKNYNVIFSRGLVLGALCVASAWGQQYTISTVVGNGTQGFSGDGGTATGAQLSLPGGIALDSKGNLYIADSVNNRIRMVSNGTITTVAGNGTAGYAGDGKSATSANLNNPQGVAVDASGNIFIADTANDVIRKVSGGNITTFAGNNTAGYAGDLGLATAAQLFAPTSVAVDSSGNVYIADSGNNVIREVYSSNSFIYSIVGGAATAPQFSHPNSLALDTSGNIFVADTVNRRVVKFTPNGQIFTQIAGNGLPGFSGDNGPALNATIYDPYGVALDASGNVYVTDTFNSRIRKIFPDGTISSIAGNGIASYSGDGGRASAAGLYFPHSVAVDSQGRIYFADTSNNVIRLLQLATPVISDNGVGNGASFSPQISAGALASVFGTNFASGNTNTTLPLGTSLAGVSVTVNGVAAPILFVGPTQVNFQVPWETTGSSANITVNVRGSNSNTIVTKVLGAGPGLFTYGVGRAVVQNQDFSLNTANNPAKPGSTIIAYLTGSGPVTPAIPTGTVTPASPFTQITGKPTATIGSAGATVTFAGLTPNFVGLLQINIVVPTGLADGDYPLAVAINGETSNSATISIHQ